MTTTFQSHSPIPFLYLEQASDKMLVSVAESFDDGTAMFRKERCADEMRLTIDPEADEATNRVEELPESHDLAADVRGCELSNVDWSSRQGYALSETDDTAADKESGETSTRTEGLYESGDNDQNATCCHANSSSKIVGDRTTEEPSSDDGTDGVGSVDATDGIVVGIIEVRNPIVAA